MAGDAGGRSEIIRERRDGERVARESVWRERRGVSSARVSRERTEERAQALVVVDEGPSLAKSVLEALIDFLVEHGVRTRLLIVGDVQQIPPIYGNSREETVEASIGQVACRLYLAHLASRTSHLASRMLQVAYFILYIVCFRAHARADQCAHLHSKNTHGGVCARSV